MTLRAPYYQHEGVTIYNGDCLSVLPELPDSSVDLILTDPPYFKVKGDAWDNQWDTPADFLAWLDRVLVEFARILKPNGSLYLFASPQMGARVECLVNKRFEVLTNIRWRKKEGRHRAACKEELRAFFPASETIIFAEHFVWDFETVRNYPGKHQTKALTSTARCLTEPSGRAGRLRRTRLR